MTKQYLTEDKVDKKTTDAKDFMHLLRYAKKYWLKFSLSFAIIALSSILAILSAKYTGSLVEDGLRKGLLNQSIFWAIVIISLEALSILSAWFGKRVLATAASKSILMIRKDVFNKIQSLPISYFDKTPLGRTVTRMTHDIEGIENFFSACLGRVLSALALFIFATIAMFMTNLKLGIFMLLSIIPAIIFTFASKKYIRALNRENAKRNSACNSKLSEYSNGISVIRSFGLENWSINKFNHAVDDLLQGRLKANRAMIVIRPLISLMCLFPMILLIFLGGLAILSNRLSVGSFVSFIRYCEKFTNPISMITREIHIIQQAFTSSERISTFLKTPSEDQVLGQEGTFIPHQGLNGKIEFCNLSMRYDDENPVLNNINLIINPGEMIGLVGETGSGKTTTISLLSRLYPYQEGNIHIDDIPIELYSRNYLRNKIGYISQDIEIFKGTLKDNLSLGEQIDETTLLDACRLSGFIKVMDKNSLTLRTSIEEKGSNLSIGEKQLLSFTRIILRNPSIIILDEATANVDHQCEHIIHQTLKKFAAQKTCLIVAHRLDTIMKCDRLVVFKNGKIIETGDHKSLLSQKGHYYSLQKNYQEIQLADKISIELNV